MAKKEQEMYEGMPVIEASDSNGLKKKLANLESRPEKYVVRISNRSTKIKVRSFKKCADMAVVIISDSVTEIGEEAFSDCTDLTSIVIGNSVTKIGWDAFKGCTGLTSIVIPDSVTEIGEHAFYGCTGLTSIVIPDSVTEIGDRAFFGCMGLTSIVIPDSVTEIGEWAFYGCTGLTSIVIPDSVTEIGKGAFGGCTVLTSIVVSEGKGKYDSRDNCNAIIETESNTLIAGCKSTVIPSSVTEIGTSAFSGCTGLTSIAIPDSVTEIGRYAFSDCSGLTSIAIPDSVTEIGEEAFSCTGLKSIIVSDGNKTYDSRNNCNAIIETETGKLIKGCDSTIIPDSVTKIGEFVFSGCTDLTSIVIPDSVTEIGEYAFSGCTGLTSIVIPDSVTEIGEYAFSGCTGLTSIAIPDSVTEIGGCAFYGCTGLTSIAILGSVTKIGCAAFWGCSCLTSICVSEGNKKYDSRDNCNAIIETATNILIKGCATTVIPDSVTEIGVGAFYGCTGLTSIVIPDSVTKISCNAFNGCTGLTSIVIGNSVTEIGDEAFSGCTGLTSIVIPDSVKTIGGWAFSDCAGLTTASVLGPVKLMNATFKDCTALECVTLGAGIKKIIITDDDKEEACAFGNCSALKTINVPAKKADYYKSRLPEELHGLIVELPAEKKAKAKKTAKKVIKGGKVEVTIHGHLEILEYCSQSLINEEESFNDNYYVTYGWSGFDSIKVGTETIKKIDSYLVKKAYFAELFKADGPHPLPVDARWRDEENVEATYIIELADDEEFDIDKIEFVEPSDAPEVFEDCSFVADHILYDGKEIVTDSLSDYSAEDMFNSPGWEGEIDVI